MTGDVEGNTMKVQCPISKILLPLDGSEHSKRAAQFAGYLGASLGESLGGVGILRVVTGRYMSSYMAYVDFRAEILKLSDTFKKFKERYFEEHIRPSLDEGENILRNSEIEVEIEKIIAEGDPAREIVRIADEKKFSTIIMARRGLSEIVEFLIGSVTSKVVHMATRQAVYVVGRKILTDRACPIPAILVPVDGSSYARRGAEHAAYLAAALKYSMRKITLLRVINLARYLERIKEGIDPEEEASKILEEGKNIFLQAGVPEEFVTTRVRVGEPAGEILKETNEGDYNLVVMGRKGRTALKDLILGGVSSTVLHRCQNPTVAIMSSE
ncbi:MAG: universal stress protein [Nitrospira sp.]|nr:universal stress protein [Nitrospira sp.]